MSNDFYTETGAPSYGSSGISATIRSEFAAIGTGFGKLAPLTGNGSKYLRVNSGATAYEARTDSQVLSDIGGEDTTNKDASGGYVGLTNLNINFSNVAGTYTSYLTNTNTASRTYTFPDVTGTVAVVNQHTITEHSDVSAATGANLETLTDGSVGGEGPDLLHQHSIMAITGGNNRLSLVYDSGTGNYGITTDGYGLNQADIITEFNTDGTLADNSDYILSTQKAIKTYVDTTTAAAIAAHAPEDFADTDITAEELETLSDGSNADSLHVHEIGGLPGVAVGCIISNNSSAPTTDLDISAGTFIDSTGTAKATFGAASARETDKNFGTDNGIMLDSTALASDTCYLVYGMIRDSDDAVLVGALADGTAYTSASEYATHSKYCVLGCFWTDSSGNIVTMEMGEEGTVYFAPDEMTAIATELDATSWTNIDMSSQVPSCAKAWIPYGYDASTREYEQLKFGERSGGPFDTSLMSLVECYSGTSGANELYAPDIRMWFVNSGLIRYKSDHSSCDWTVLVPILKVR
jgi:hypothetical protein